MYLKWCFRFIILPLGLWVILDLVSRLGAETLWFQEVGYLQSFLVRITTQSILCLGVVIVSFSYLLGNLVLARRWKYPHSLKNEPARIENTGLSKEIAVFLSPQYAQNEQKKLIVGESKSKSIKLIWLLPITIGLSFLLGLMVTHYGQVAISYWNGQINQVSSPFTTLFRPEIVGNLIIKMTSQTEYLIIASLLAIALLIYTEFLLWAIATVLSLVFGLIVARNWDKILLYFNSQQFTNTEPLFNQDISFYIFSLPLWELLAFWLIGLSVYSIISVALTYFLSGDSFSQGFFPGFSTQQKRHLLALGSYLMLVVAFSYWLSRYELVYSSRGVNFGASFTDVTAQLPADTILCVLAVGIAFYLLSQTLFFKPKSPHHQWVLYSVVAYLFLVINGDFIIPGIVQYLIVQPNELQRETPYITRTINLTRQAFDLQAIDSRTFNPTGKLTRADIEANDLTIQNIRLWDQQPLLKTNRQLQQIRPYYRFPDADIDRYIIKTEPNQKNNRTTEKRQVLIAARELDYDAVPEQAKTWVNRNFVYTHGYGFTMSPVNTVAPGGLPEYFVKDISGNGSALTTSSPEIRASIPIGEPRIYYGEITNTHVMTGTKVKELDYPSGSDNVYNTYDGKGGIRIGSLWRRWLFSMYLKDWRMIFTRDFLPETKVLFRRNINERIREIAPFLKFDSEPYLVTTDTNPNPKQEKFANNKNYLYWIVDAYTISDRYPYSEQNSEGINYIRNSVKVVIDAYNGNVNFYVAEPKDPIINAWSQIFPKMLKPLAEMPENLRSHIRYPVDFFNIQAERLMIYHITNPQVFYNREDQWQIPNEIYGTESRQLEPYYLITSLPDTEFAEFILLLPYTPKQRNNLTAWLAARSDGENYGKLLLYNFPKERLIYGTEQIEARINQDPVISQQISLWNRQGSRAVQGNLLIIPIQQSLLYVEPIYLEATQNSLPTLVRVVVAYENRIVMAQTLEQALEGIFKPEVTPAPAIIRPVEEEGIPPT
ncbi:MAG: UPF0182 family protein [Nostocales cyanobacterium]|nr:MAG: UPF0182 family protein [Nostocales cyanobacterium]